MHTISSNRIRPLIAPFKAALRCGFPKSLVFVLAALSYAAAAHSQNWATDQLVIYFRFNGNMYGEPGYGGYVFTPSCRIGWDRFGTPLSAIGFSAANYGVNEVSKHPFREVTLTYSCWVLAERIATERQCLFSVASFYNLTGPIMPNTRSGLALDPGVTNLSIVYTGQGNDFVTPTPVLSTNEWHHVALTKSGQAVQVFLDGEWVAGGYTHPGQYVESRRDLYIGRNGNTPGEQFYGWLDELRVYSRALSAAEVKQLYRIEALPRLSVLSQQTGLLAQAVNLYQGTNYQLEVSDDLLRWTEFGAPFQPDLSGARSQAVPTTNANGFLRLRRLR